MPLYFKDINIPFLRKRTRATFLYSCPRSFMIILFMLISLFMAVDPSEGAEQEGPSLAAWEDAFRCAYKKLVLNIRRSTVVQWRPIFLYLFDDIKIITCIRFCGSN